MSQCLPDTGVSSTHQTTEVLADRERRRFSYDDELAAGHDGEAPSQCYTRGQFCVA
jgi:hypothetical protein